MSPHRRFSAVRPRGCDRAPSPTLDGVAGPLPIGEPVPASGELPAQALGGWGSGRSALYLHVPFCLTRCGYCDFNTYTGLDALHGSFADAAVAEVRLARRVLGEVDLPVQTVFVGGGTPTLLPAADLVRVLDAVRDEFGLAPGAEVTTEANPDSVDRGAVRAARGGLHPRLVRHAVGGVARARGPGPHPHPGTPAAGGAGGLRRRLRPGQPRPHLRHAGGVGRRLAGLPGRRGAGPARPTSPPTR